MAVNDGLAAVGSQNHVSFVDARQKQVAFCIANVEHNHGEKSILSLFWQDIGARHQDNER